ncbi:hypothetical protein PG993_005946 [Apiospora rasikravindrae]|uniref:Uncharacterized protein n=1 Tax=Apiospora rasikravindrae TaxID=990691 RepID=A0ABR1TA85_9PEZI
METTFPPYQGQPDDAHPRTTWKQYMALAGTLLISMIPVGFVLLHIALYVDEYIQIRERIRLQDETWPRRVQHEQAQDGRELGQGQDLERNMEGEGVPEDTDWIYSGASESSHLLSAAVDPDPRDVN